MNLSHSFSSMRMYDNCPKRYYLQRITKAVSDPGGEASLYGERIHKSFEDRIKHGTPLPPDVAHCEGTVVALETAAKGGELVAELELTLDAHLRPTGWWDADAWMRSKLDVFIRKGGTVFIGDWKGLALDTKIPTPTGWTTMGAISVGDTVYDANGSPCCVIGKSKVKQIRCYEVTFNDTTRVICDEEHLWKLADGRVINVKQLMGKRNRTQRINVPRIAVAAPLTTPYVDGLPIPPYVLGIWLADGKRTSGEVSKPDPEVWEKIAACGYLLGTDTSTNGCTTRTILGLRTALREISLLGNKHIPDVYMRAGYNQRLELLRGLMDGDGYANTTRNQAVFTTTNKQLAGSVRELLCSLGQRPLLSTVTRYGFGKTVLCYELSFRPIEINPFSLSRKSCGVRPVPRTNKSATRYAISVVEVEPVPTQCIAVDSADHTFLCTELMIPTHNTGKRRPDPMQLELFALQAFAHYPDVKTVKSTYFWVKDNATDSAMYKRNEAGPMWNKLLAKINRIEQSLETDNWPARPSGLCRFCPARNICEFAN